MPEDARGSGKGFHLTPEEDDVLREELSEALEQVLDSSGCSAMLALWVIATRNPRKMLPPRTEQPPLPPISEKIRQMGKSSRSKYASLAAWRHAICWQKPTASVETRTKALRDIYFTPFVENKPPYSWSRASSKAPASSDYVSPSELDLLAALGCWDSIQALRKRFRHLQGQRTVDGEIRAAFVKIGFRPTLKDVLRLESIWEDWDEDAAEE